MNWGEFAWLLLDNADKYFLIAGPVFFIFYILLKKRIKYKKIQQRFPKTRDYWREIFFSVLSIIIFSFPPLFMLYSNSIRPYTTFYEDIAEHGWLYAVLAFPLMLLMHDTYFYWLHRIMHQPQLFKLFHLVHHKSNNPSPWAAYAFHPLEAIAESLIFVIFLFTIPMHSIHLTLFFVVSLLYNVYGHLGYELYPKGFTEHWFGKWINTSVSHNMHHQYFKGNYGLYFTMWDRIMGTLNKNYEKEFKEVKSRKKITESKSPADEA
ncbi:sterol desaturase family protein [Panacibacter ginsenosidivorans]|uniref:Sterol desaturase family protein n=1 Tax=Panacibacter ginsenosidivorans TaxID=1813871 RepID=A0A5B8VD92_9BACT|nr:sterol desaturase family protein [Panacibacter ginsenosidivorans]QEC69239.1 sterol desaturase family protein [Panacibacter ginsenosidivorans]